MTYIYVVVLLLAIPIAIVQGHADAIVVACLGDSITRGSGASHHKNTYPYLLKKILGFNRYEVRNYGVSGATAQNYGSLPYTNSTPYKYALRTKIDVAILQLGTNDAKMMYWDEARFKADYDSILQSLQQLSSKPRIIIAIPPPLYQSPKNYEMRKDVINEKIPPILREIAVGKGLEIIDNFSALGGSELTRESLFADGCHPNDAGYQIIANAVGCVVLRRKSGSLLNEWSDFVC